MNHFVQILYLIYHVNNLDNNIQIQDNNHREYRAKEKNSNIIKFNPLLE